MDSKDTFINCLKGRKERGSYGKAENAERIFFFRNVVLLTNLLLTVHKRSN
jgi:hypothetical protein